MVIDITSLNRLIVATLRADTVLKSVMGVTTKDPRIYQYYQGEARIIPSEGKNAYITFALTADPERIAAVGQPVYTLAVWAADPDVAQQVVARVHALLDFEGQLEQTITADDGTVYQPVCIGEHWSAQENTKFAGVTLQIRFGHSHV